MTSRFPRLFLTSLISFILAGCATHPPSSTPTDQPPPDTQHLTLQPVSIDPMGAPPNTPWYIHMGSINIRNAPSTEGTEVIGRLNSGTVIAGTYLIVDETDEEWLEIEFAGQNAYVSRLGFSRVHPDNLELIERYGNLPYGRETVNRWWGIPLDYEPDDLVTLPPEYTREVEGRDYRLRREAAASAVEMLDAMRTDGLDIYISSPYRSGSHQASIYNNRMRRRGLNQRGTAPPGHSEHQLGTTMDLSSTREGRSLRNTDPQHAWLVAHGHEYGWRQTYTAENIAETGYIEEPWHWRYLGRGAIEAEKR